ncbi:MAG: tol-pal system YbgF family protein [Lewinella sp.]
MSTTNNKFSNPDLTEIQQEAIIGSFVRRYENERLRKRWIDKLSSDYQVSRPTTQMPQTTIRKIILPIIGIAAALLLLLAFLPGFLQVDGPELMASHLTEATIENSRSEPKNELEQARVQLIDNYAAGNFSAAAIAGEALLKVPGATDEDRFYLGLAFLRNNNLDQAITSFKSLLERPTDFSTEAHYYLGISLLSNNDTAAGLKELKKIKETDGRTIHEKAQQLLQANWD